MLNKHVFVVLIFFKKKLRKCLFLILPFVYVLDYNTYVLLNFPVKRQAEVAIVIFVVENKPAWIMKGAGC